MGRPYGCSLSSKSTCRGDPWVAPKTARWVGNGQRLPLARGSGTDARVRILVVKTSSLGDVIHTLPAVTDAARALPGLTVDWVVERDFAAIPAWHPAVARVVPVAVRAWRKRPTAGWRGGGIAAFRASPRGPHYDAVIAAQGLMKR